MIKDIDVFKNHLAKVIYYLREQDRLTYAHIGEIMGISGVAVHHFMDVNMGRATEETIIKRYKKRKEE